MVHDMDILHSMDSRDGERSPVLSVNSKERRLRRSSGAGLRASPSQTLLSNAISSRASPGNSGRNSPTTLPGYPSNRGSPVSPLFSRENHSSSDVMDDIPPPRPGADKYPGMSNTTTPTRRLSEKGVSDSTSDGTKKAPPRYSSEKSVPGTTVEKIFSADEVVEQLMKKSQDQISQTQSSSEPRQGSANDNLGSMLDDKTTTTTIATATNTSTTAATTATTNTTNTRYPQQTTTPHERSKKRASPTPMILERRGSFRIRTNEMGKYQEMTKNSYNTTNPFNTPFQLRFSQ